MFLAIRSLQYAISLQYEMKQGAAWAWQSEPPSGANLAKRKWLYFHSEVGKQFIEHHERTSLAFKH